MTTPLLAELTEVAHALADAAREPVLRYFRSASLQADNKDVGGFDPVTAADREAESAMRAILAVRRPDDAIHGEEHGLKPGTSGLTWVLDPVDGTRAFLCGAPVFGVLIAVHDGTRPILGLVDQPYVDDRFLGLPGPDGAAGTATLTWRGEKRAIRTRQDVPLDQAILLSTFPEIGLPRERDGFNTVASKVRLTRYGLDCTGYALLALGQADLVIEAGLAAYDIQAPMALVQAAGGIVTDWRGLPCDQGGQVIAAGCPALHAEALALLAPFAA